MYRDLEFRENNPHALAEWEHLRNMTLCDFPQDGSQQVYTHHDYCDDYFQAFCTLGGRWEDAPENIQEALRDPKTGNLPTGDVGDQCCNTGPGGLGKSAVWAMVAYEDFKADPKNTLCILISTSLVILNDRIYGSILTYHEYLAERQGRKAYEAKFGKSQKQNPQGIILYPDGSRRTGLICVSAPPGETLQSVQKQIGRHAKRTRMFQDEANAVAESATQAGINLGIVGDGSYKELKFMNGASWLDPAGADMVPSHRTRKSLYNDLNAIPKWWRTKKGLALFQDGRLNPSVNHPDGPVAGMKAYPFLPSFKDMERIAKSSGGTDSFFYWVQAIGMIPPDGTSNTVLSEGQVMDNNAMDDDVTWVRIHRMVFGFDPSYQGKNKASVMLMEVGVALVDQKEKLIIRNAEKHDIRLNPRQDIEDQLVSGLKSILDPHNLTPRDGGIDASVGQIVVANAIERSLGKGIYKIGFGEGISGRTSAAKKAGRQVQTVSASDPTLCSKAYKDRPTEIYMNIRQFVLHGHIRNMPKEVMEQITSREIKATATPMQIVPKDETGSDDWDEADAFAVALTTLREVYGIHPGGDTDLDRLVSKQVDAMRDSVGYASHNRPSQYSESGDYVPTSMPRRTGIGSRRAFGGYD